MGVDEAVSVETTVEVAVMLPDPDPEPAPLDRTVSADAVKLVDAAVKAAGIMSVTRWRRVFWCTYMRSTKSHRR